MKAIEPPPFLPLPDRGPYAKSSTELADEATRALISAAELLRGARLDARIRSPPKTGARAPRRSCPAQEISTWGSSSVIAMSPIISKGCRRPGQRDSCAVAKHAHAQGYGEHEEAEPPVETKPSRRSTVE